MYLLKSQIMNYVCMSSAIYYIFCISVYYGMFIHVVLPSVREKVHDLVFHHLLFVFLQSRGALVSKDLYSANVIFFYFLLLISAVILNQ